MAQLDAVVYPQDSLAYGCRDFYGMMSGDVGAAGWGYEFNLQEDQDKGFVGMLENGMDQSFQQGNWESSSPSAMQNMKEWDPNSSPEACTGGDQQLHLMETQAAAATTPTRRKRRRTKSCKNKEELESQRMTHIAVERNRRKQMNDYLSVIRSLMPSSYVQRGDQASIIGGAINFVKELEQHLQTLEAQKRSNQQPEDINNAHTPPLFADFFTFPQYSTTRSANSNGSPPPGTTGHEQPVVETRSALGDIEVTMVESHANLKILSKRRPRQLLKLVAGLQCLWFTILHLNVTTVEQMVLYSISVKLEDGCQLTTVDEIADAINLLLGRIEEEAAVISS